MMNSLSSGAGIAGFESLPLNSYVTLKQLFNLSVFLFSPP